ncbi:MBL fold metallo-hydrolase [Peribacillus sp. B-H-3]|uniref:MBL fold metallo-hydrolase n=1 Tax=Peribacillus sp. B-H-3 TaxID=3400420 RepID=UPI003B015E22
MDDHHLSEKKLPVTSVTSGDAKFVTEDIYCFTIQIVNVCFIGKPAKNQEWVLVDAGMPGSAEKIIKEAEELYGKGNPPAAIILTHGHFDHIGSIVDLIEYWNAPVYAHKLELPYLTGQKDYPEPDSSVEGGMVAKMSRLFPNEGIDLDHHVSLLPEDGSVPGLSGWKWIWTPGHSPGHISLFRESDRSLIAGDAFVTVKQENLYKVITQEKEISGPPRYLTTDWKAAKASVLKLEQLKPSAAVTGHGRPMIGTELAENLARLAREFDTIAVPDYGKFVD